MDNTLNYVASSNISIDCHTTYSQLYLLELTQVPQDVIDFFKNKADTYKNNGCGYDGKDYTSYKSVQIDVNANADEDTILNLINTNTTFVDAVNEVIKNAIDTGLILKSKYTGLLINGIYDFNKYHGMTDHNKFIPMIYEQNKSFADLLRSNKSRFSNEAAWSVEVKSSHDLGTSRPSEVHKADIVLKHVLGTNTIQIFLPEPTDTRGARTDAIYHYVGSIEATGATWHNIRINYKGYISQWT